jgi:hypothetical protein
MRTKEILLPVSVARAFLESCMSGPLALTASRRFAPKLPWSNANAFTFAEPTSPLESLHDFKIGGKSDASGADTWLLRRLKDLLAGLEGFVLVEDWQLRPTSGVIVDYSLPAVFVKDEVYYAVAPGDSDFDLVTSNTSPCFVGFVVALPKPVPGTQLTQERLDDMANDVVAAYCGAYDGESFILVVF